MKLYVSYDINSRKKINESIHSLRNQFNIHNELDLAIEFQTPIEFVKKNTEYETTSLKRKPLRKVLAEANTWEYETRSTDVHQASVLCVQTDLHCSPARRDLS